MNICDICCDCHRKACEKKRIRSWNVPLETFRKAERLSARWNLYASGLCVFG